MRDAAQTKYAPKITINSQIDNVPERADPKNVFSILHVDDDLYILDVSKKILEIEGKFEVDTALSVDEAFQKMGQKKYDAVISDYEMPRQDGLTFLKLLREQQNNIPFVLFTGKGREDVAIEALNLGSDAYISKIGDPETVYGELSDSLVKTIERKQSKKLLAESESKYRRLVENSLQGIVVAQGLPPRFVFANTAMGKITGYSPEELVALSPEKMTKMIHPDDRETFFNRFSQSLAGKETESIYQVRGIRKDGSTLWLEASAKLIEYNGQPAVQGMFLDITERKKAEEAIWQAAERNYLYLEAGDLGAGEYNFKTGTFFLDERACRMLGVEKGTAIKPGEDNSRIHPEDKKATEEAVNQALTGANDGTYRNEFRVVLPDNSMRWVTSRGQVFFEGEGSNRKPTRVISVYMDITERKKAEQKLMESESKYRNIFNNSEVGMFRTNS